MLAYIKLLILSLSIIQNRKIFVPYNSTIEKIKDPSEYNLQGANEFSFLSGNGERIFMWIKQPKNENHPIYVFFHGNTGHFGDVGCPATGETYNRRYRISLLQQIIESDSGFIAVSLRGYGRSEGKPSEQSFDEDILNLTNFLNQEQYNKIFIIGESLGANSALKLGTKIQAEKIILIAPFLTLHDAVTDRYPEFKRFNLDNYLHHKFDNLSLIKNYNKQTEINIFHAKNDETTSVVHSQKLYNAGKENGINIKLFELDVGGHISWNAKEILNKTI